MNFVYRLKQLILVSGDIICFGLAFFMSLALRQIALPSFESVAINIPLFIKLFAVWIIINFINGLYDLGRISGNHAYRRLIESCAISVLVSIIALYLTGNSLTPKTLLILSSVSGYGLAGLWRFWYSKITAYANLQTRIIFLGYNTEVQEIVELITKSPEKGYVVSAIFDPEQKIKPSDLPGINIYTSLTALRPAITTHKAHSVVSAPHLKEQPEIVRELYELLFWPVHLSDSSSLYETITGRVPPSTFSDGWFISNLSNLDQPSYNSFRRLIDYIAGITMGLIFITLGSIVALVIKLTSRGPVLYRQMRVGYRDEHFSIYKFRTMYALSTDGSAEMAGAEFAQKDDKRVTPFGRFLRRTRLDELPQFWNLLRGDITLIGPRPERPEIVAKLEAHMPYYPLRHLVKPGITGWAAINQHYTSTLAQAIQKLQYDLYYIKNRSLLLDISIMLRTINVVLRMMGQ